MEDGACAKSERLREEHKDSRDEIRASDSQCITEARAHAEVVASTAVRRAIHGALQFLLPRSAAIPRCASMAFGFTILIVDEHGNTSAQADHSVVSLARASRSPQAAAKLPAGQHGDNTAASHIANDQHRSRCGNWRSDSTKGGAGHGIATGDRQREDSFSSEDPNDSGRGGVDASLAALQQSISKQRPSLPADMDIPCVIDVVPNSPASRHLVVGDVILSLNGHTDLTQENLARIGALRAQTAQITFTSMDNPLLGKLLRAYQPPRVLMHALRSTPHQYRGHTTTAAPITTTLRDSPSVGMMGTGLQSLPVSPLYAESPPTPRIRGNSRSTSTPLLRLTKRGAAAGKRNTAAARHRGTSHRRHALHQSPQRRLRQTTGGRSGSRTWTSRLLQPSRHPGGALASSVHTPPAAGALAVRPSAAVGQLPDPRPARTQAQQQVQPQQMRGQQWPRRKAGQGEAGTGARDGSIDGSVLVRDLGRGSKESTMAPLGEGSGGTIAGNGKAGRTLGVSADDYTSIMETAPLPPTAVGDVFSFEFIEDDMTAAAGEAAGGTPAALLQAGPRGDGSDTTPRRVTEPQLVHCHKARREHEFECGHRYHNQQQQQQHQQQHQHQQQQCQCATDSSLEYLYTGGERARALRHLHARQRLQQEMQATRQRTQLRRGGSLPTLATALATMAEEKKQRQHSQHSQQQQQQQHAQGSWDHGAVPQPHQRSCPAIASTPMSRDTPAEGRSLDRAEAAGGYHRQYALLDELMQEQGRPNGAKKGKGRHKRKGCRTRHAPRDSPQDTPGLRLQQQQQSVQTDASKNDCTRNRASDNSNRSSHSSSRDSHEVVVGSASNQGSPTSGTGSNTTGGRSSPSVTSAAEVALMSRRRCSRRPSRFGLLVKLRLGQEHTQPPASSKARGEAGSKAAAAGGGSKPGKGGCFPFGRGDNKRTARHKLTRRHPVVLTSFRALAANKPLPPGPGVRNTQRESEANSSSSSSSKSSSSGDRCTPTAHGTVHAAHPQAEHQEQQLPQRPPLSAHARGGGSASAHATHGRERCEGTRTKGAAPWLPSPLAPPFPTSNAALPSLFSTPIHHPHREGGAAGGAKGAAQGDNDKGTDYRVLYEETRGLLEEAVSTLALWEALVMQRTGESPLAASGSSLSAAAATATTGVISTNNTTTTTAASTVSPLAPVAEEPPTPLPAHNAAQRDSSGSSRCRGSVGRSDDSSICGQPDKRSSSGSRATLETTGVGTPSCVDVRAPDTSCCASGAHPLAAARHAHGEHSHSSSSRRRHGHSHSHSHQQSGCGSLSQTVMTSAGAEAEAGWSVSSSRAWAENPSAHQSYKDVLDRAMASKPLKDELVRLRTRLSDAELKREKEQRRRRASERRLKVALTEVARLRQQIQAHPAEQSRTEAVTRGLEKEKEENEEKKEKEEKEDQGDEENAQVHLEQPDMHQEGANEEEKKENRAEARKKEKAETTEECGCADAHKGDGQGSSNGPMRRGNAAAAAAAAMKGSRGKSGGSSSSNSNSNSSKGRRTRTRTREGGLDREGSLGSVSKQSENKSGTSACDKSPIKGTNLLSGATAAALMLERRRRQRAPAPDAVTPPRLPRSTVRYPPTMRRQARLRREKLERSGLGRSVLATVNEHSRYTSDI